MNVKMGIKLCRISSGTHDASVAISNRAAF